MPRDWPDPRWPPHRPIRWYHLLWPSAVAIGGAIVLLVGLWPA